jgi:hypothetical protein
VVPATDSWRKLEGSDPKRYELIQKIQTLQKRLIAKTEQCVEKDLLLQEREKLYVDLKNMLVRWAAEKEQREGESQIRVDVN